MNTIIKVTCTDQVLTVTDTPVIASGGVDVDCIQFEFCTKWDGFTKTAVFWCNDNEENAYHVLIDDNGVAVIPREVLKDEGTLHFGVYGVDMNGVQRPSETLSYRVCKGPITEGTQPSDPTPDMYTQLLAAYEETRILYPIIDSEMSDRSTNLVRNNTIKAYVDGAVSTINSALASAIAQLQQYAADAVTTHNDAADAHAALFAAKQAKLSGTTGQFVGFDADGNAVAQDWPPEVWRPSIVVGGPTDCVVSCSNGDVNLVAEGGAGRWVFYPTDFGSWTVTSIRDNITKTKVVYVTAVQQYTANLVYLKDTFSENSWDEIIQACEFNDIPSAWAIGDSKAMNIGGSEYQVDIIGRNHDTYAANGNTAPLTFQLHSVIYGNYSMDASGGLTSPNWQTSKMRTTTLPGFLAQMPEVVQEGIKAVNKQNQALDDTQDKLFLLSEYEVFGQTTIGRETKPGYAQLYPEGKQYEYYINGGSTVKSMSQYGVSADQPWWLRTCDAVVSDNFACVNVSGDAESAACDAVKSVSFAFCF